MANYIGKIAAVGTINMSQIASGLSASARDVEKYARGVQSTISSANAAAGRSFRDIFTPLQRLEKALQASQNRTLDIKVGGSVERIRAIVGAANDIAKPLAASQKQFSALAATVQNEFVGALARAQNAAQLAESAINRGQIRNAAGYERLKRVVDEARTSIARLGEAQTAVSGLATGRELRFQQAGFASELQRTAALQSQASSLPAAARASGAVGQLVELQRREAEEATRLLAVLENVRNTRRGDAAAAQANLDAQTQKLAQVNSQLERQVALSREVAQSQQQAAAAAEQAAARRSAAELNRRDGVFARQNAAAFDAATAGVFAGRQPEQITIGRATRTLESELARLQGIGERFSALPPEVQRELDSLRTALENTANAAKSGAAAPRLLAEAYDRLADAIRRAEAAAKQFRPTQGNATGVFGPTREDIFPQSTTDPQGRSLPDRFREQERARRLQERRDAIRAEQSARDARIAPLDQILNARFVDGAGSRIAAAQVDAEVKKLATSLQSLSTQNQLNLDPTIQELRDAIAAGENLERQLDRIVAAQERVALAAKIESLPEGSEARRRLQQRFDREGAGQPPPGSPPLPRDVASAQQRTDLFDLPVEDSVRRLGVLQGAINSVKGQVDQLPIPLQARFVPLLSQAEAEFQRLKNSGTATAAEIAKAARNVESLKNSVTRAADAGRILSASQVRASADTARALGEIGAAARLLTTIGAGPGDAASRAYDRLAAATRKFAREGTLGTAEVRRELQRLQEDAARAAAATGRISFGAALKQIQRGGDVATGAVNNAGLAAQQALFIVDDFFSVTGDLTQRIRAIGNNITQLGLIIGQTQGLFIALGVSLGLQVTAQLIKFFNAGVEGADKSRALNEALQRQKTIVDQLAESFRNLSQAFTLDAFQGGARSAEEFRRQIEELRKQQREINEERAASLDPDVNRERAIQQARRRDLERASNPGQVVAIQREIEQSLARERLAAARAASRPAPSAEQVIARLAGQVERQVETRLINQLGAGEFEAGLGGRDRAAAQGQALQQARLFAEELRAQIQAGASPESVIRQRIDDLTRTRRSAGFLSGEDIGLLEVQLQEAASLLVDFQRDRIRAEEDAAIRTIENLRRFGLGVSQAQGAIEEAITRGVPGAVEFSKQLKDSAVAVRTAENDLTNAIADRRAAESLPQETLEQRNTRNQAIADATERRNAAQRQIEAAQQQAGQLIDRGLSFNLAAAARPDRAGPALQALQSSEAFANEYAGLTAQLQSAIERERFARERLSASDDEATQAQLKAAQAATQLAAAAAEAAIAIERDIAPIRESIDSTLQASQQAVADAERRVVEGSLFGGRPQADLERDRDQARENLRSDRERLGALRARLDEERAALLQTPAIRGLTDQLDAVRGQRQQAAERAIVTQQPADIREAATLAVREIQLTNELSQAVQEGLAATEQAITAEQRLKAERDAQDALARTIAERRNPVGDPLRGADLARSPAQRAADELGEEVASIRAFYNQLALATNGLVDLAAQGKAVRQAFDQRLEQAAPLLRQFEQERQNAVLQGPSRAAIQASDATTVEGNRELGRLLRGDDPSRDANLAELREQTAKLQELIDLARNVGIAP